MSYARYRLIIAQGVWRHRVRYFGFYSQKTRGLRAKAGRASTGGAGGAVKTDASQAPGPDKVRRRWAALIKRIWHVDPLQCPRCGAAMKVVSFINPWQRDVIDKILDHCGLSSRGPPPEAGASPPDAPPAREPVRELTYLSDLEHVQDPGPDEPVWSAD